MEVEETHITSPGTKSLHTGLMMIPYVGSGLEAQKKLDMDINHLEALLPSTLNPVYHALRKKYLTVSPAHDDIKSILAGIDQASSTDPQNPLYGPHFAGFLAGAQQFAALGEDVLGVSGNVTACAVWSLIQITMLSIADLKPYNKGIVCLLFKRIGLPSYSLERLASPPHLEGLETCILTYFRLVIRLCIQLVQSHQKLTGKYIVPRFKGSDLTGFIIDIRYRLRQLHKLLEKDLISRKAGSEASLLATIELVQLSQMELEPDPPSSVNQVTGSPGHVEKCLEQPILEEISDGQLPNSGSKSLTQASIFDDENDPQEAFSSTLPTSHETGNLKTEIQLNSALTAELGISKDSNTIYSIDSTPEGLEYIRLFAKRLIEDVQEGFGLSKVSDIPSAYIMDAVGAFTGMLHQESTNIFQWEASVIIHRKRQIICSILAGYENNIPEELSEEFSEEEEFGGELRIPFQKSHDYLQNWAGGVSPFDDNDDEDQKALDIAESSDLPLSQLPDYEEFIYRSDAYRWLLWKLCQHGKLSFGDPNLMADIGAFVLSQLKAQKPLRTMSRHRPLSLVNMTFHLEWNPKAYVDDLKLDFSPNIFENILCLTGTLDKAQFLTVSGYMHQTWPVTGGYIQRILQELVTVPEGQECTCAISGTRSAHINACIESEDTCTISVTAGAYLVSEISEQVAWMAATLRHSPLNEGIVLCRPNIQKLSVNSASYGDPAALTVGTCWFSFEYDDDHMHQHDKDGLCWAPLFCNPILVSGFPILRRPESRKGLEMSLGTMSSLVQSNQLVQYGERLMMKGFSSLLIVSLMTTDVISWHLLTSRVPGERISYFDDRFDAVGVSNEKKPWLRSLESLRHIVGWCVKATDYCGHTTANCVIAASKLQPSPYSVVIDRMYIEGGMSVIAGLSVRPNKKEQPIKLHRERDYPELLQMVAAHPVAFYDATERRAWLVDGASALLHLVRISLRLDATDLESAYDWVFDETKLQDTWDNCSGRVAALKTLKSWDNRDLPVYIKRQSTQNGKTVLEFSTFGDRVDKILHFIEVIIDRDIYIASEDGLKVPQTLDFRRSISGFDLLDIIKPLGPIGTRIAHLGSQSEGWVDLFSSIGVTTIFGEGFGDLIRPDEPDQVCSNWKSIPIGQDYMAVSVSTLKMIQEKRLQRLATPFSIGEFTRNLLWTSPCHPFQSCICIKGKGKGTGEQKHVDPVQSLVSKKFWRPLRKPNGWSFVDVNTLDTAGAVVFANTPLLGRRNSVNFSSPIIGPISKSKNPAVSGNSSQASTQSASASDMAPSTGLTNITTPSQGSAAYQDQQVGTRNRENMKGIEWLKEKWSSIRKK